ncbi:hypothetical protein C8Q70DRAFT_497648 [Cubamyces menziesii]|nr:hypothetical protein C8Q70DRAFT_497648 [Cubamyces menziesii]
MKGKPRYENVSNVYFASCRCQIALVLHEAGCKQHVVGNGDGLILLATEGYLIFLLIRRRMSSRHITYQASLFLPSLLIVSFLMASGRLNDLVLWLEHTMTNLPAAPPHSVGSPIHRIRTDAVGRHNAPRRGERLRCTFGITGYMSDLHLLRTACTSIPPVPSRSLLDVTCQSRSPFHRVRGSAMSSTNVCNWTGCRTG